MNLFERAKVLIPRSNQMMIPITKQILNLHAHNVCLLKTVKYSVLRKMNILVEYFVRDGISVICRMILNTRYQVASHFRITGADEFNTKPNLLSHRSERVNRRSFVSRTVDSLTGTEIAPTRLGAIRSCRYPGSPDS